MDLEAKKLLELKAQFKTLTGQDWKPDTEVFHVTANSNAEAAVEQVLNKIADQGHKVRQLKSQSADKTVIETEVNVLVSLKADYKKLTGSDWKLETVKPVIIKKEKFPEHPSENTVTDLLAKISKQGDKVRLLKNAKEERNIIDTEVKLLLALKTDYKSLTGQEWKPGTTVLSSKTNETSKIDITDEDSLDLSVLLTRIKIQGDKIRKLKSENAPKSTIDFEVQTLLSLKGGYKEKTGTDWTPNIKIEPKGTVAIDDLSIKMSASPEKELLTKEINAQADKVRVAKSTNLPRENIDTEVKKLLALKTKYKEITGTDFPNIGGRGGNGSKKGVGKNILTENKETVQLKAEVNALAGGLKKQTRLGLEATKEENLPEWYSQVYFFNVHCNISISQH